MKLSAIKKLYIGFATAITISLFIGIANYLTFRNQAIEGDWVAHTYEVKNKILAIENIAIEMQTRKRGFRATGDKVFANFYNVALKKIDPVLDELKHLTTDNSLQQKNANLLAADINTLVNYWESIPSDSAMNNRTQIANITKHEKELMDKVRADVATMQKVEATLLVKRETANNKALLQARLVSAIGTILVLIIILILVYSIISEFKNRRRAEEALKENLNELSQMNEITNNKNWLLSGVANINDSLQGKEEISALSEAVINALVQYMQVPAAALYFYDGESEKLVLKASASLPANAPLSYALGEGLVGHAATRNKMVVHKNVPSGYWTLQSASGSIAPGEILCLPLWNNNELKGVLEVASFGSFDALKVEFLEAIGKNIAIALNAADARERVLLLLDQVQEQKVHLQNQQEELHQTNEELTRQAEVLQASEEELRVQEEELRQINSELEEKNEAIEISRQALANKARELEITGKYKSEFLANMSHELRTPLNSVLILAKLLSENRGENLTEKQIEYARIIHKSGTDLLNLINDILDLSKIEAGKIDFHFEEVKVKGILEDLGQTFHVVSEEKNISFIQKQDENVPNEIFTDKLRLEQVIKNLLSNAFKFTPAGGNVTLSFNIIKPTQALNEETLRKASQLLEISVADTGIGIAKSKHQLIFEAFQQADGSTSRKYGGTGLGLSISKELVKKLGGELQMKSEEGRGSTFTIYLPLNKNVAVAESNTTNDNEELPVSDLIRNITLQSTIPDDRHLLEKGDKIMLIIEDDPHFARVVQDFARSRQFRTIIALYGDEGLYYAKKYKPSAIILDMQLPVLDGWSLLKILKSDPKLKSIPVHVISGTDNLEKLGTSAIAYIRKPVQVEDLENAFDRISEFIASEVKKVLIVSGDYLKNDALKKITAERLSHMQCDYVSSETEAIEKLKNEKYDCIVADIGKNLKTGIDELNHINTLAAQKNIPVIIYLDKDITSKDEMKLKKISGVIIQDSKDAKDRLVDELELFLYKMEEVDATPYPRATGKIIDEKILAGKKVLLVDDDMRNVFAISTLLEEQDMKVVTAMDGKEALTALNDNADIDIILMDVMMPEMDGYEAMKKIRLNPRFNNLPIIALTAKAMQGDKEKSIAAGASDYITKPVDSNKLFSLMRVWLSV